MNDARHAILQVLWGPEAFRKVVLSPGDRVRVGRSEEAELCLPRDPGLEKVQFEVDWDGERCELRDRHALRAGKGLGTLLDGLPAVQARVAHGSWIHAGSTDFVVYHEARTPRLAPLPGAPARRARAADALAILTTELAFRPRELPSESPLSPERGARVGAVTSPRATSLYGVFDAARDERVLVLLREAVEEHRSLYEGVGGHALADVAPYVVRFDPGSRLLRALVEEGWGEGWGVYLVTDASAKEVRRHLRRFLMVEKDSGDRLYFRWYDPRVLRDFLLLATVRQKSELFGDLRAWLFEGAEGEVVRAEPPAAAQASQAPVAQAQALGGEADVPHP